MKKVWITLEQYYSTSSQCGIVEWEVWHFQEPQVIYNRLPSSETMFNMLGEMDSYFAILCMYNTEYKDQLTSLPPLQPLPNSQKTQKYTVDCIHESFLNLGICSPTNIGRLPLDQILPCASWEQRLVSIHIDSVFGQ
jgi:hypothetical protein